jgi:hypothetical protein
MVRLLFISLLISNLCIAQFAPSAGQAGSTAIHKDSSIFKAWATECKVFRGFQDISDQSLGYTTVGDSSSCIGKAGENGVLSLGDGGYVILSFNNFIKNGEGYDFAIFENSFTDTFLELAFVEVSSDGENFVRFPAVSNTQDTVQTDSFGATDATKINNLAGKYRGLFGTPFDLEELKDSARLNINAISHIKIIDVVGSINPEYASYDKNGRKINDPFPTPFPSGGFDLDAIGVINNGLGNTKNTDKVTSFKVFPTVVTDFIFIQSFGSRIEKLTIIDVLGNENELINETKINLTHFTAGFYWIKIIDGSSQTVFKIIKN